MRDWVNEEHAVDAFLEYLHRFSKRIQHLDRLMSVRSLVEPTKLPLLCALALAGHASATEGGLGRSITGVQITP